MNFESRASSESGVVSYAVRQVFLILVAIRVLLAGGLFRFSACDNPK